MRYGPLFGFDLLEGLQWSMLPPRGISGSVVLMHLGSGLTSMAHINHRSLCRCSWSILPPRVPLIFMGWTAYEEHAEDLGTYWL